MNRLKIDACVIILSVFAVLILSTKALWADVLEVGIGDWAPYVTDPSREDKNEGYLVDIMREIFEKEGHKINTHLYPFARNVKMCRVGKLQAITGCYKGDVPDFIFPRTEQGEGINTFYTMKGNTWKYKGISSLGNLGKQKLGVIAAYDYGDVDFQNAIKNKSEKIFINYGDKPLVNLIRMMKEGIIDVIVEDNQVAQYNFKKLGITNDFQPAGNLGKKLKVYIVFSPTLSKEKAAQYTKMLDDGVVKLRKSGRLQAIMQKYGLKDWK